MTEISLYRLLKSSVLLISAITVGLVLNACVTTSSGRQNPDTFQLKNANAYRFFGGPGRGQFRHFSEGISEIGRKHDIEMVAIETRGSFENIHRINSDPKGFSLAYATHIYQARNGKLWNDYKKYEDIMVVGYLFGSYAHLVVKAKDNITSAMQLVGKRVAVGKAGSGYVEQAKKFFEHLGIWNKIEKVYIHHNDAVNLFRRGEIDAFWVISGFPNGAVMRAAAENKINLVSLYKDGQKSGFFQKYPYFIKAVIPGTKYRNVDEDIQTFLDATLWVANRHVPDDVVYRMMETVYGNEGIELLTQRTRLAINMRSNDGKFGLALPLHSGAKKYYQDRGLNIADDASPQDLFDEGERLAEQGRHTEAIENYKRVLESKSNTARQKALVHFRIGLSYAFINDSHNAISNFTKAIEQNPNFAAAYAGLGVEKVALGKIKDAIEDLSHAIELDQNLGFAYHNRAVAYMKINQLDLALPDFNKTISLNPKSAKAFKNRAALYLRTDQKQLALIDMEKSIMINPSDVELLKTAIWIYATDPSRNFRDGRRAVELAQNAVALLEDSSTLDVLAAAYAERGDFGQAVQAQKRAIALVPAGDHSQKRANLEKHLASYLNNTPWRSQNHSGPLNKAELRKISSLGLDEVLKKDLPANVARKILQLAESAKANPENVETLVAVGNLCFDNNINGLAIAYYQKSLTLNSENAAVWCDLGIVYRRTGNSQKALSCFDRALSYNPKMESAYYNKGIVLLKDLNNASGAIRAWQKLIDINPSAKTTDGKSLKSILKKVQATR